MSETAPSFVTEIAQASRNLREEFQASLKSQRDFLVTGGVSRHEKALLRIDAVEKAAKAFEENLNRVPTNLDRETHRLETLFDEKLRGVAIRIDAFHDYAAAMRDAAKDAIAAALASLKEITAAQHSANAAAVQKAEAATTKEIDAIKTLISSTGKAFDTEISNLTDRLNRGEGRINRGEGALVGGKEVIGFIIGGIGTVAAIIAIFVGLHAYSSSPAVGVDTKRVDDLILQSNENARQMGQRMDALSARINQLTPPITKDTTR